MKQNWLDQLKVDDPVIVVTHWRIGPAIYALKKIQSISPKRTKIVVDNVEYDKDGHCKGFSRSSLLEYTAAMIRHNEEIK